MIIEGQVHALILNTTHVQPHTGVAQRLGLAIDGLYDYEWPQRCINPSVQLVAAANNSSSTAATAASPEDVSALERRSIRVSRQTKADKSNPADAKRMEEEDQAVPAAAKGDEEEDKEAGEKAATDSKVVIPCESPAMPPLDKFSAAVLLYA